MTRIQRFAIGLFGLAAVAATGFVLTAPRAAAVARGDMAPAAGVDAPVRVAAIGAHLLTAGPVVAIAVHRDRVYLLQNHSWLRVDATGGAAGPFGSGARGGAGVIASGAAIVATDSCVYVLDRLTRALLVYDPAGAWTHTIALHDRAFEGLVPHTFAIDDRGRLLVSGYRSGQPGHWSIVALNGDTPNRLYSRAGGPFDLLLPLGDARGHAYALSTADYAFEELGSARRFARRAPPRVRFPASAHALTDVPIPDFIPVVAHALARPDGTFLVAIAATPDAVWVEQIDAAGRPLRTLLTEPVALPVGFSDSAIYTLREDPQQTIVERRALRALP